MSVDFLDANKAWAEKLGLTYPLLSDVYRKVTKAYDVLYDDPKILETPESFRYLRSKRAWAVIDKEGIIRFIQTTAPRELLPNDAILKVLSELK